MSTLVALFHHRWAVPVIAELHRQRGSRFVTLAYALGISRESLRRTLEALVDAGHVVRNPGHGHSLRPEYVLTADGRRLAPACVELVDALRRRGLDELGLRKWSLPILFALRTRRLRFGELRDRLPGISARALTLSLKDLDAAGLVERHVLDEYPPATVYELTRRARPLAGIAARIAA